MRGVCWLTRMCKVGTLRQALHNQTTPAVVPAWTTTASCPPCMPDSRRRRRKASNRHLLFPENEVVAYVVQKQREKQTKRLDDRYIVDLVHPGCVCGKRLHTPVLCNVGKDHEAMLADWDNPARKGSACRYVAVGPPAGRSRSHANQVI